MPCLFLPVRPQVSSGLERGGFTFQGDVRGEDFGKFKLERQGERPASRGGGGGWGWGVDTLACMGFR